MGLFWQSTIFRGSPEVLRQELPIASTAVSIIPAGDIVPRIDRQSGVVQRSNGLQKLGKIGILVMVVMMVVVDVFFGGPEGIQEARFKIFKDSGSLIMIII